MALKRPMVGEGSGEGGGSLPIHLYTFERQEDGSSNMNGSIDRGCAGEAPLPNPADISFSRIVTKSLTNFLSTDASIRPSCTKEGLSGFQWHVYILSILGSCWSESRSDICQHSAISLQVPPNAYTARSGRQRIV